MADKQQCSGEQVSSPAESEPSGRVLQVQVPMLPPSGVIYEGDLAIFQAKIFDEEVWVVNNNHSPVNSISVKEEGDLSLSQEQDHQKDEGDPKLQAEHQVDEENAEGKIYGKAKKNAEKW